MTATLATDAPAAWIYHARGVQGLSRRLTGVVMDLRVVVPFRARWTATLTLAPHGTDDTEVGWTISGRRGPVARLRARRAGTDATIAGHLERGLAGLARIASFMALGFSLIGIGWFYTRQLRPALSPPAG